METRTINQTVVFKAGPHEVYEALMDSAKHSEFTGAKAEISREVGGEFSAYGGYCSGTNTELVPNKKIVQSWRAGSWPEGYTSTITLLFDEIEEGTELTFTHEGVPTEDFEGISEGWHLNYWEPIKKMLEKNDR
jgi:activator of HSP90 ATPase